MIYDFIAKLVFGLTWSEFILRLIGISLEITKYQAAFQNENGEVIHKMNITSLGDKESHLIYDSIGIPGGTDIYVFKRAISKTKSSKKEIVTYTFESKREMTILEFEWATRLNRLKVIRRTSPYIPYLKNNPEKGITFSAYYLIET